MAIDIKEILANGLLDLCHKKRLISNNSLKIS